MLGLVNGFVHTIMYGYYLATSIKPSYGKSLWWKRYITQLQLLQFGYLLIHFSLVIFWNTCGHPLWVGILGGMQSLFMLCMFSEFYFKAYLRKKKVNWLYIPSLSTFQNKYNSYYEVVFIDWHVSVGNSNFDIMGIVLQFSLFLRNCGLIKGL